MCWASKITKISSNQFIGSTTENDRLPNTNVEQRFWWFRSLWKCTGNKIKIQNLMRQTCIAACCVEWDIQFGFMRWIFPARAYSTDDYFFPRNFSNKLTFCEMRFAWITYHLTGIVSSFLEPFQNGLTTPNTFATVTQASKPFPKKNISRNFNENHWKPLQCMKPTSLA